MTTQQRRLTLALMSVACTLACSLSAPHVSTPLAITSFKATPDSVTAGTSSVLSWQVTGADHTSIAGIGDVTGTSITVTPSATTTYVLTASAGTRQVTASATVTVMPAAPVINAFTATPARIRPGDSATLAWDVSNAMNVSLSGIGEVTGTSYTAQPTQTTTYTLTATNGSHSVTATTTVTVQPVMVPTCGNGQLDSGEACDPSASPAVPAGTSCATLGQGFSGGTLSCDAMCHLVTSQCTAPATVCSPGATRSYYDGPAGTVGVGTCKAGVQRCASDGSAWVVSTAEVTPQTENCGNPQDVNCDGQPAPACTPSTQHPRLWVTQADLPRLQSRATSSNPIYAQGIQPLIQFAEQIYNVGNQYNAAPLNGPFYLNGQPNPNWPDAGGAGVGAPYAESYAELYAFVAMLDPTHRTDYAQKARNLLMYALNAAANCPPPAGPYGPYAPYCDPEFPIFNRANYVGEAWGLTVDWLQAADPSGQIYTTADKALTRQVFLKWAQQIVNNTFVSPDLNYPLLNQYKGNNQLQFRTAANNYYSGNTRNLTLMALSLDAADDPPVDGNAANVNVLGNTLRSYIPSYVLPVRLYQQYAIYEDPAKVAAEYNLASLPAAQQATLDKLGLASGGLPVEGFLYGHSLGYVMEGLLALHTSGNDGITQGGNTYPQANLINSTYWDSLVDGFVESLMLQPIQPPAPYAYLKPVYQMATFGDLLYEYIADFDFLPCFTTFALNFERQGKTVQQEKALWVITHTMPGGASNLASLVGNAFNNSGSTTGILAFLALDPGTSLTSYTDPRPSMPTTFTAAPLARVVSRTDWTTDASLFTHLCGWASINHENGTCGQFELYRKGEWLTKERSGYDNGIYPAPAYGYAPDYHNILGIQNNLVNVNYKNLGADLQATYERGGQWNNNTNAGDPTSVTSFGDAYVYAQDISTNLYNFVPNRAYPGTNSARDIQHASRSILWLKPDHVVVYDRAQSQSTGLFKRFNLVLVQKTDAMSNPVPPTVNGSLVTGTTPNGQSIYVQSLLPATPTTALTTNLVEEFKPVAELDPTERGPVVNYNSTPSGYHLRIEDTTNPTSIQFLTVVQGADPGQPVDPMQTVTTTGLVFNGAAITKTRNGVNENLLALFRRDIAAPLAASWSATCTVPIAVPLRNTFVADLQPSTTYYVTLSGSQLTLTTNGASGGTAYTTDSAGLLQF